jgi:hypothetical protein
MSSPASQLTSERLIEQAPTGAASGDTAQSGLALAAIELTEALQALTSYVAAAVQVEAVDPEHSAPRIHEILRKANLQVLRANSALKQLRENLE